MHIPLCSSSVLITDTRLSFLAASSHKTLAHFIHFYLSDAHLNQENILFVRIWGFGCFLVLVLYLMIFGFISLVYPLYCYVLFVCQYFHHHHYFFPQSLLLIPGMSTYTCSLLPFKKNPLFIYLFIGIKCILLSLALKTKYLVFY